MDVSPSSAEWCVLSPVQQMMVHIDNFGTSLMRHEIKKMKTTALEEKKSFLVTEMQPKVVQDAASHILWNQHGMGTDMEKSKQGWPLGTYRGPPRSGHDPDGTEASLTCHSPMAGFSGSITFLLAPGSLSHILRNKDFTGKPVSSRPSQA